VGNRINDQVAMIIRIFIGLYQVKIILLDLPGFTPIQAIKITDLSDIMWLVLSVKIHVKLTLTWQIP